MRPLVAVVLLLPMAGCLGSDLDLSCDELSDLPRSNYPLDAVLPGTAFEIAQRLASAVGDSIVSEGADQGEYVRLWNTERGSVSVTVRGGMIEGAGYWADDGVTDWDGSQMRLDLHNIMHRAGADPADYRFEGPVEGDFDDSLAVYARKGAHNSFWRLQVVTESRYNEPSQSVLLNSLRDPVSEMAPERVGAFGLAHAECSLKETGYGGSVWLDKVHTNTIWMQSAPGRYVDVKTEDCGGYVIVDVVTGANLEHSVSGECPDYET